VIRLKATVNNNQGFTLIEIMAVLIIMGIIIGIIGLKMFSITDTANQRTTELTVSELNSRENLTWHQTNLSTTGYTNDNDLFNMVDYTSGNINWDNIGILGGTLITDIGGVWVNRTPSNKDQPGKWSM